MSTHVMTGTQANDKAGNRVRAVLASESEVCHVWQADVQSHGRFRAIYFSGRRLYSYGSHYVIGELREPGVVLLNAESNSVTTNGHRREAESATRHMRQIRIPDLTAALKIIDDLSRFKRDVASEKREGADFDNPDSYASRAAFRLQAERKRLRAFVKANALGGYGGSFHDSDSGDASGAAIYLLRIAGYPAASWPKLKAEAEREAEREKAAEKRRKAAEALADAKLFGEADDSLFGEYLPPDSYRYRGDMSPGDPGRLADGNGQVAQKSFAKRVAAAHKASKAAGYTNRTARLWRRVKEARAWAEGFAQRERQRIRAELEQEFETAREAGNLASLPAWRFPDHMAAQIEAARQNREAEQAAADYESWRQTPTAVKRPESRRYPEGSTQREVLEGFERQEIEAEAVTFERWREAFFNAKRLGDLAPKWGANNYGVTSSTFALRFPDIAERLGGDPWREVINGWTREEAEARKAAEAERERLRNADLAEKREAWSNGFELRELGASRLDDGNNGALIRVEGEELVTSQGARVPQPHAIKSFRFVKLIRETGRTWQRNGRTIRVGHYQIDSIDSEGFNAGCHRINWPEIERVAKLIGVFDLPADDTAAEPSAD